MKKIYVLYYGYNQYDQLGGYAMGFFSDMPDFATLKKFFEDYAGEFPTPHSQGLSTDACYGKLIRGDEVSEYKGGGEDEWSIVEEDLC